MIGQNVFRDIQTTEDLNGPILSIIQNPVSVSVNNGGSATFTGLATARFPTQSPANPATGSGYIAYQWYEVGRGALTDGTNIIGSSTKTLQVLNLQTPTDNGRQFYLSADYVPSGIGTLTPSPGLARTTGTPNAINEPTTTGIATAYVRPSISITQQPDDVTAAFNTPATFSVVASSTDLSYGNLSYQWVLNGNILTDSSTVIGSATTTLSISLPNVGINTVRAIVSQTNASNSPLYSNTANLSVVDPRSIINVELIPGYGGVATRFARNLYDNLLTIRPGDVPAPNIMCFYAPEKDIDVLIDIAANSGSDYGSYSGGQGGKSTIALTLKKLEEYVITSISQLNTGSSIFLYHKARLIACVGGGGNAGTSGNGGDGGGVNIAGAPGGGTGGGAGGILYAPGTLPSNGIFGSTVNNSGSLKPGDSQASTPNGGRVIPCPKGIWYDYGFNACDDVGRVKFRVSSGSDISNSTDAIMRGFKAGYGIRNTAGAGYGGGNGGNGATGGAGGVNGGGGGGGSGYTNGSVTVVSTQQGGNTGLGYVNIYISSTSSGFYTDSLGRILILSAATPGKDPRTLTKTTGMVLPGTDTCIDDARWQRLLNLALNVYGYRLTATLDNFTTRIVNATDDNIRRMINANVLSLQTSLTAFDSNGNLAWDETSGATMSGYDYSLLNWTNSYKFGYYGDSSNPFFVGTTYNHTTANWWILPPGVPDF